MSRNRFEQYRPNGYTSQFVPTQIDANVALNALGTRQQAFDNTLQYLSEFNPKVDFMNDDQQTGQKIRDSYMSQLNTAADDLIDNDNIQGALKNFFQIRGQYNREASSGDIWGLAQRKATDSAYLEQISDFSKQNPEEARIAQQTYLSKRSTFANKLKDEKGDYITNFESPYLFKTPAIADKLDKIAGNIKADGRAHQFGQKSVKFNGNTWLVTTDGKTVGVDEDKARAVITLGLAGDPEIQDYIEAMTYHGLREEAIENINMMMESSVIGATYKDETKGMNYQKETDGNGNGNGGDGPRQPGQPVVEPAPGNPINLIEGNININQKKEELIRIMNDDVSSRESKIESKQAYELLLEAESQYQDGPGNEAYTKLEEYKANLTEEEVGTLEAVSRMNENKEQYAQDVSDALDIDVPNVNTPLGSIASWVYNTIAESDARDVAVNEVETKFANKLSNDPNFLHNAILTDLSNNRLFIPEADDNQYLLHPRGMMGEQYDKSNQLSTINYNEETDMYEYLPHYYANQIDTQTKYNITPDEYEKIKKQAAFINEEPHRAYLEVEAKYNKNAANYVSKFETKAIAFVPNTTKAQLEQIEHLFRNAANGANFTATQTETRSDGNDVVTTTVGANKQNAENIRNKFLFTLNQDDFTLGPVKVNEATDAVSVSVITKTGSIEVELKDPSGRPNSLTTQILGQLGPQGQGILQRMQDKATGKYTVIPDKPMSDSERFYSFKSGKGSDGKTVYKLSGYDEDITVSYLNMYMNSKKYGEQFAEYIINDPYLMNIITESEKTGEDLPLTYKPGDDIGKASLMNLYYAFGDINKDIKAEVDAAEAARAAKAAK